MSLPDQELRDIVIQLKAAVQTLDKTVERLVEKTVSIDTYKELERRVASIEGGLTWAIRLVVGAVILALVALVIRGSGG